MSNLQLRVAKKILEEFNNDECPESTIDEAFELLSAKLAIKEFHSDESAIRDGILGGGGDGGVDWLYVIVDNKLVDLSGDESIDELNVTSNSNLKILIGQAKNSNKWEEQAIYKLERTFSDFLSYGGAESKEDELTLYGPSTKTAFNKAVAILESSLGLIKNLEIDFWYFAMTSNEFGGRLQVAFNRSCEKIKQMVSVGGRATLTVSPHPVDANELIALNARIPSYDSHLRYERQLDTNQEAVALVNLVDYYDFLTDDDDQLKTHFFEDNVRDFAGGVKVNQEIRGSLEDQDADIDFWWLNNGVTILVDEAPASSKSQYTLKDVRIVNGLQTSVSIFNHFSQNKDALKTEKRHVLVRIMAPSSEDQKTAIIRATNSQSPIQADLLRSTDPIHQQIESILRADGIYYDRRKNFWKNNGKPLKSIISIKELSQAAISAILLKPDTARARPNSFLANDKDYKEIYDPERPLEDFSWCAKAFKMTDRHLFDREDIDKRNKNNLRYYVLMVLRLLSHVHFTKQNDLSWSVKKADSSTMPTPETVDVVINWVSEELASFCEASGTGADEASKGPDFKAHLESRWEDFPFSSTQYVKQVP